MVLNRRLFILVLLILALACPAEAAPSDYVRLHVIAADDTDAAQALKLEVRDAVLDRARALLKDTTDAEAAWHIVLENVSTLERAARQRAAAGGYDGPVRCEAGIFPFPDRVYGDVRVPAGDYRALRVVIGAGEGHNWWCVLYPSLCEPSAMPDSGPVFYSAIWNWLRRLFGGDAS